MFRLPEVNNQDEKMTITYNIAFKPRSFESFSKLDAVLVVGKKDLLNVRDTIETIRVNVTGQNLDEANILFKFIYKGFC